MVPEVGLEPTRCYPLDFESSASAIPPLRHVRNINYYTQTLQSCQYTFTNYFLLPNLQNYSLFNRFIFRVYLTLLLQLSFDTPTTVVYNIYTYIHNYDSTYKIIVNTHLGT